MGFARTPRIPPAYGHVPKLVLMIYALQVIASCMKPCTCNVILPPKKNTENEISAHMQMMCTRPFLVGPGCKAEN